MVMRPEARRTASPLEFSSFHPTVQKAIEKLTKEEIRRAIEWPPGTERRKGTARDALAKVFNLEPKEFSNEQVKYFERFLYLATRQFIIGSLAGEGRSWRTEDQGVDGQLRVLKQKRAALLHGDNFFHDAVSHSWAESMKNPEDVSLVKLTPAFYRSPKEAGGETKTVLENDEELARLLDSYWDRPRTLAAIRSATDEEDFLAQKAVMLEEYPRRQLNADVLRRVYREYPGNEELFFEMFVEATFPLMREHEPKVASALVKKHPSYSVQN
jgi:hypothetical protein